MVHLKKFRRYFVARAMGQAIMPESAGIILSV
jgi:hypothetical protein